MTFEAYMNNIRAKTGKGPKEFFDEAVSAGVLRPDTKTMEFVAWLLASGCAPGQPLVQSSPGGRVAGSRIQFGHPRKEDRDLAVPLRGEASYRCLRMTTTRAGRHRIEGTAELLREFRPATRHLLDACQNLYAHQDERLTHHQGGVGQVGRIHWQPLQQADSDQVLSEHRSPVLHLQAGHHAAGFTRPRPGCGTRQ